MVVNINKNSACFDETLNVLKFSALAQKVRDTHTHTQVFTSVCLCPSWMKMAALLCLSRWWC